MRTRAEISDDPIRQSEASLIFVKLRKMIASDTQPTDTILGTIAVAAHTLTGATGAAIAMPRDGSVVCVGRSGETAPELGDRLNVDSGISGECLRTGVILRCDDASRDFHVDAEVCRQLGLQSIAVVPLRGQQGRVGVLEAFSTESYAFTEDKMEVLGRLAGLAEAAWARGAVTTVAAGEESLAANEVAAMVEAPAEPDPTPAALPLAAVREAFATVPDEKPPARRKWRYAAIAAGAALALALLSFYAWNSWYRASVASRTSHPAASRQAPPAESGGVASGAGFAHPDVVRPVSQPHEMPPPRAAKPATIPDEVIRRATPPERPPGASGTPAGTPSSSESNAEEVPQIAASGTGPTDLGMALSTTPALPRLGVAISQGTGGGVLVRKVQPLYPEDARRFHVEGNVVIDGIITVRGQVEELKLVSGHPLLASAAMDAVRKWRYTPYLLNGKAVPKQTRIIISFIAPE